MGGEGRGGAAGAVAEVGVLKAAAWGKVGGGLADARAVGWAMVDGGEMACEKMLKWLFSESKLFSPRMMKSSLPEWWWD